MISCRLASIDEQGEPFDYPAGKRVRRHAATGGIGTPRISCNVLPATLSGTGHGVADGSSEIIANPANLVALLVGRALFNCPTNSRQLPLGGIADMD
jgi:hypothetical protein